MGQRIVLQLVLTSQLLLLLLSCVHYVTATVTLTSSVDGRQATCPREVVTYTCTVIQGNVLEWSAGPFGMGVMDVLQFTNMDPLTMVFSCNDSTSLAQCSEFDYRATLTDVGALQNGFRNMTSNFTFTAYARLNETAVGCMATLVNGNQMLSSTLNVAGVPPSPRTPSYTVQQYRRDNVILTVQWQPSQDGGGAPVDNYTITVSPGLLLPTTATSANITIPYSVMRNVRIVATNCNGSSSAVIVSIPAIVGCGAPSHPENGSVQSLDISQSTGVGSEIFFSCNTSYAPAGNMTSECASNGMWNPDPATFVCIFDCGPPPAPRNGSLESYTNTTEGSVVFYSCDPGLVPEMRMMSVCTGTGWSPNPGALDCSVVDCGTPTAPQNGTIEMYQSTLVGAEIFFMCNPSFVPAERMSANCTSNGIAVNGTWTPNPATLMCNASDVDCGVPSNASSEVIVQYSSTVVGSTIVYQCQQSGFAPSSFSAVCMESGRWSPDPSQVVCRMVSTMMPLAPTPTQTATSSPPPPPETAGLGAGATAAIAIVILLIAVLVVAIVIVGVVWWRKRSGSPPKPPPQSDDVAMYSVVDDSPVKPAPYKGYMLKGPEAEYSTVDEASSPSTSKAVEAQYDLPPGSNHPEGLVYAEVNVKPKPSNKPHTPKPDKTDDRVEYAAIAYQPKDTAEKSPPVVEPTPKRMALPDNPDDSVNLDNLLIQLKQVNTMWRELGDALGLPPSILDDISGQYQSDPQQCMVEMLDSWLMKHMHQGSPTWWEVAQALRQIARSDMADALETVYSTGVLPITVNMDEIPEGSLPAGTGSPPPIPVRGPLTDEPDYPPPKPPRNTPEKKAAPPRPPRGGSERKPKPEPGVPPRPPRAN